MNDGNAYVRFRADPRSRREISRLQMANESRPFAKAGGGKAIDASPNGNSLFCPGSKKRVFFWDPEASGGGGFD